MMNEIRLPSPGPIDSAALVSTLGENSELNLKTPNNKKTEKEQKKTQDEASSDITLKPFIPNYNRRRKRQDYTPHPALTQFDTLFGIENWSRYLTLKSETKIASGMLENKLLNVCPTAELGFRLTGPNEWLVEATTKNQSQKILAIKEVNRVQVTVTGHNTLNYIQGTVYLSYKMRTFQIRVFC